jgi:carbon-monoxide dehydrogenase medium subunit
MYPAAFEYHRPSSVQETIVLLQQWRGKAKILAGGHSLLPLMKLRLASPAVLIDIGRVEQLVGIRDVGDKISIGAATTYWQLMNSDLVQRSCPILAEAAAQIGDVQVRNRGTIGGGLAHADPAADMPPVALALGAELRAIGPSGERTIAARDFFVDLLTTALAPDELLTEIRVPKFASAVGGAYLKFKNPASGYAIIGVAAIVCLAAGGRVTRLWGVDYVTCDWVRVGVTGVSNKSFLATGVEEVLTGLFVDESTTTAAAEMATHGQSLLGDMYASSDFRAHLAKVYTQRALIKAAERARTPVA